MTRSSGGRSFKKEVSQGIRFECEKEGHPLSQVRCQMEGGDTFTGGGDRIKVLLKGVRGQV